jgi:hypothetical protein
MSVFLARRAATAIARCPRFRSTFVQPVATLMSFVSTPSRFRSASRVLCVLACALAVSSTFAAGRAGRGALAEARGARQAERAQQRAARIGQQRESAIQSRTVEPPLQPAGQPPGQPLEAAQQVSRPGRLTLEERRALRQQINEAGRDVYRPNRP